MSTGGGGPPSEPPAELNDWDRKIMEVYGDSPAFIGIKDSKHESGVVITSNAQTYGKLSNICLEHLYF